MTCALQFFARLKRENEVKCEIMEAKNGYYVSCRILDVSDDLLDMKLYAPDMEQAKLIRNKIMLNPSDFYGKIMSFALFNVEEEIVLNE